ncbi:hypothetical protein H4696_002809 [Amycolatopsis lexingtonensis]|uniref:DUF1918 domain-containing protein n=1 Tax=Amycolatopsis lexingtonensis TaxID=218822 RepID=A0ABR9HXQ2_9PSEU|nr:DUF1918 domain-containing protein [Amycolatopsis lexingtonensis]MBE1495709.1 hypothetical protein [Amycolatopsis lexingtonensis]
MHAQPGDWLVVKGPRVDAPEQRGRILEVRSADGAPPYVVRWTADDHVSTVFPGPDAVVLTAAEEKAAEDRASTRFDRFRRAIHEEDGHVRVR